jgi:hypothetical protein
MLHAFYKTENVQTKLKNLNVTFLSAANNNKILREIEKKDRAFQKRKGLFLLFNSAAYNASEEFSRTHAQDFRNNGRPSLPSMAMEYASKLKLEQDNPYYNSLLLIALRAETDDLRPQSPHYHSTQHYADVFALMANFMIDSNTDSRDAYLGLIAAMGHDIAHPGTGNPPEDAYKNERTAFEIMLPILKESGLNNDDIEYINIMLKTTSPNGPHSILKSVAHSRRHGIELNWDEIDSEDRFPELEILLHDEKLLHLCAMLSDADLFTSAGAGMNTQLMASRLLSEEEKAAGKDLDFTTDKARMFFFDFIVGKEGFVSNSGRKFGNESYNAMRAATIKAIG